MWSFVASPIFSSLLLEELERLSSQEMKSILILSSVLNISSLVLRDKYCHLYTILTLKHNDTLSYTRRKNSEASLNRGVTTIAINLNCKCWTVETSINENVLTIQKLKISCTPATRENKPQDLTQSAKNQIDILKEKGSTQ